ncbi:MAG: exodeoxyribonuclease V subunit gamma [Planctomycetes bacterium]|nr:exodeoxyribonuclease V subunit gamma [Planctomycetota bacterium]
MGVRLIAGRAGSGKTHRCLSQIRDRLAESLVEGSRLILLVPEQAGLQMERSLLAMSGAGTLGRCEVLSFRRLAHRILSEAAGPSPVPLTPYGRQMALRLLISRNYRRLREFAKVAERPGFVHAISLSMAELMQEAVTIESLQEAAGRAESEGHPAAARLHDVSLLYHAYLEYLGSERVDPEGVLDLSRARMGDAPWLQGAEVWIDGFAGFTRQQARMILALGRVAGHVDIALLLDPARVGHAADELSLFARTERTWAELAESLREEGVTVEPAVFLNAASRPRFASAPMLDALERDLFSVPRRSGFAATTEGEPNSTIRFVQAPDRRSEVTAAVRAVQDLVTRANSPLRYRDIAIVVRDLEPYHDLISAALQSSGIPFFIDRRRPTYHHPLVQVVRAALSLHSDGRIDRAMSALFKSGLSGLPDDLADAMENYALAHGLVSAATWDEPWRFPLPGMGDEKRPSRAAVARLGEIEAGRARLREQLGDWWPSDEVQKGKRPCREWTSGLFALLERLQVTPALGRWCHEATARGELDEADEHQAVWNDFVKLLDELVAALGDEAMTRRQFREVLESGLSQLSLGLVPSTLDQVLVSSIERSRHPPVKAVLVIGFGAGQFPASVSEDTILADEERGWLEAGGVKLTRTRKGRLLDERMLAYIALTRPSEFLWVSYPTADERGRELGPSPYWGHVRSALPDIAEEVIAEGDARNVGTEGELVAGVTAWARERCQRAEGNEQSAAWAAAYEWGRSNDRIARALKASLGILMDRSQGMLSKETASALWRSPYRTSVTAMEQYAECPFRHFAARGLSLQERHTHDIAAMDMGKVYHRVLEQFVNELIETGRPLTEIPVEEIAANLDRLCKSAVPEYAEQVRMEEREKRLALWRGGVELPPAVRGAKALLGRTRLRPWRTEMAFGLDGEGALPALEIATPKGRKVLLRGRVDRVDLVQGGQVAVVFDYKRSSGSRLKLDRVYHGLALQLLSYLLVLRNHVKTADGAAIKPGGAFFLPLLGGLESVGDPIAAAEDLPDPAKAFRPRGIVDFDAMGLLVSEFGEGQNQTFNVFRKKDDGSLGNEKTTDAVKGDQLPKLLDYVHGKLGELADSWIDGDVHVRPARLGRELPCTHCVYRGVCRYDYSAKQTNMLAELSRPEAIKRMTQGGGNG